MFHKNWIPTTGFLWKIWQEQSKKVICYPFKMAEAGMELLNILYDYNISNHVIENIVNEFPLIINDSIVDNNGKYLLDLLEGNSDRKLGLPNVFSLDKSGELTLEEMLRNT